MNFDSATAALFLRTLFQGPGAGDGLVELVFDDSEGDLKRKYRGAPSSIDTLVKLAERENNAGRRMYFGAGLRRPDLKIEKASTNTDILSWSALVWDFDTKEASEYGLAKAREIGLEFHYVVETGRVRDGDQEDLRVQCWALLDKPCADLGLVSRVLQAGIRTLGSDKSIHDARRVMRLPGSVSWARKDGRVDELTRFRHDLAEIRPRYTIDELCELLEAAAPAPVPEVDAERIAEVRERLIASGADAAQFWRESDRTTTAIADLISGVEMNPSLYTLAHAAARDGRPYEDILAHLQLLLEMSEGVESRPERTAQLRRQLPSIVRRAVADSGVAAGSPPVAPPQEEFAQTMEEDGTPPGEDDFDARERMFAEFVWCEDLGVAIEISTGKMLDRTKFDLRWWEVGRPGDKTNSGWAVFAAHGNLRQNVTGLTFRPGQGRIVHEHLPDMRGPCVNLWLPPVRVLPTQTVSDADIRPWLDLAKVVIPDAQERETALDWMAWVAQNPETKPGWALVLGSTFEGVGKDTLIAPLIEAVGKEYHKAISADALLSQFNDYAKSTKLLVVNEMANFEKMQTSNTLKPLIAAPPDVLRVREVYKGGYFVPNLLACLFMTNEPDALKINEGGRRYFVIWNDDAPESKQFYDRVWEWVRAGGSGLAAKWLMDRDVSRFDAKGRAPSTSARDEMIAMTKTPLQAWVAERIESQEAPFDTDLIALQEAVAYVHEALPHVRTHARRLLKELKPYGARMVVDKPVRYGFRLSRAKSEVGRICALRRVSMYAGTPTDRLRELFKEQYEKATQKRLRDEFAGQSGVLGGEE